MAARSSNLPHHAQFTMSNEDELRISQLRIQNDDDETMHYDEEHAEDLRASGSKPSLMDPETRDEMLRAELVGLRQINTVVENVVSSLEKAKSNMEVSFFGAGGLTRQQRF